MTEWQVLCIRFCSGFCILNMELSSALSLCWCLAIWPLVTTKLATERHLKLKRNSKNSGLAELGVNLPLQSMGPNVQMTITEYSTLIPVILGSLGTPLVASFPVWVGLSNWLYISLFEWRISTGEFPKTSDLHSVQSSQILHSRVD